MSDSMEYTRLRLLTFDAGGTLVHSDFDVPELVVRFGAEMGLDLSRDRVASAYADAEVRYQCLYSNLIYHREFAKLEAFWQEFGFHVLRGAGVRDAGEYATPLHQRIEEHIFGANQHAWKVFDDVVPVLREARLRGLTLGVVSNWDHTLTRVLEIVGLAKYFQFVLSSGEIGCEKPGKRIFKAAIKAVGVTPNEALHIGDDYEADILGASPLGITPMLIDRQNSYPNAECIRLTDLRELWDFI